MKKYLTLLTIALGCQQSQNLKNYSKQQMEDFINVWSDKLFTSDEAEKMKIFQYALDKNITAAEAITHFCGKDTKVTDDNLEDKLIGIENRVPQKRRSMPKPAAPVNKKGATGKPANNKGFIEKPADDKNSNSTPVNKKGTTGKIIDKKKSDIKKKKNTKKPDSKKDKN